MASVLIYTEADGRVKFIIEKEFFQKYGITVDYFVAGEPIPEKVFDELFDMAEKQIDSIKFDRDAFTACIDKVQDRAELVVKPMTLEEKRKELKKLRNDREYLRQYLIKNGII